MLSSFFISHTINFSNKFTHLLILFLYEKEPLLSHKGYAICFVASAVFHFHIVYPLF